MEMNVSSLFKILTLLFLAYFIYSNTRKNKIYESMTRDEIEKKLHEDMIKSPLEESCVKDRKSYYFRKIDGSCNWLKKGESDHGKVFDIFERDYDQIYYQDGISEPREGPNPREVSNIFFKKHEKIPFNHTPVLVGIVEFVIHDLAFSRPGKEIIQSPIPKGDDFFDPEGHGNKTFKYWRVAPAPGTGTDRSNPRQHINAATTWLDLSPLYGSEEKITVKLRTFKDGKLKVIKGEDGGDYPPFNIDGLPMNGFHPVSDLFAGGDERSNEDWAIMAVHTLFLRNHNRYCDLLIAKNPDWEDEQIFETARHLNIAHYQVTLNSYQLAYFNEDMPFPLSDGFGLWRQFYQVSFIRINPLYNVYPWKLTQKNGRPMKISQELTVGYRFHDLVPDKMKLIDERGKLIEEVMLVDTAFNAKGFFKAGIENVLRGMAESDIPNFHSGIDDSLRNVKFDLSLPQLGDGFDMAAWTIIQERERGLPTFNNYFRKYIGEVPVKIREKFEDFTTNPYYLEQLKRLYKSPDDVDLMVGLQLDEEYYPGTSVPRGMLIISLFSLFGIGTADRFSVAHSSNYCWLQGKPWDCTPSNILDELLWKSTPLPFFPRARWYDEFWVKEIDLPSAGLDGVRHLIVKNTNIKCLQKNPLFPPDEKTNPVVCSTPDPESDFLSKLFIYIFLFALLLIVFDVIIRPLYPKKKKLD